MRLFSILSVLGLFFFSCKKDNYTTEPQIKFKSINPEFASSNLTTLNKDLAPILSLEVTDAEGDLGFIRGSDTAKIFIKNLKSNNIDSFNFPDIKTSAGKKFKAEVQVNLFDALECVSPGPVRPRTDTLYFEVYVIDFAKNKSNVIITEKPVFYRCL